VEVQDIPQPEQTETIEQKKNLPTPSQPAVPIESEGGDLPEAVTIGTTESQQTAGVAGEQNIGDGLGEEGDRGGEALDEEVAFDAPPKLIKLVKPDYPAIARKAGIEGMVVLKILVNVDGHVIEAKVMKSLGNAGCDEAAIDAAMKCKFEPALRRGKPVQVWVSYPVRFMLMDSQ
jgi:protein TonB